MFRGAPYCTGSSAPECEDARVAPREPVCLRDRRDLPARFALRDEHLDDHRRCGAAGGVTRSVLPRARATIATARRSRPRPAAPVAARGRRRARRYPPASRALIISRPPRYAAEHPARRRRRGAGRAGLAPWLAPLRASIAPARAASSRADAPPRANPPRRPLVGLREPCREALVIELDGHPLAEHALELARERARLARLRCVIAAQRRAEGPRRRARRRVR